MQLQCAVLQVFPWCMLDWLNNLSHFLWHSVFMSLVSGARVSGFLSRVQGLYFVGKMAYLK